MKYVRPVLPALFCFLLILQIAVCVTGLKLGADGRADFRQLYTGGYMVRSGHGSDLYNYISEEQLQKTIVGPGMPLPFDHLAYEALLFAPLSLLGYSTAYFVFAIVNVLLLVSAQHLLKPYVSGLEALGTFVPEAIFFCFLPAAITIVLGQDSILLLVLTILAFVSMNRGQDLRSGLFLSMGFFKFQFLIPIVLLFLLWRKWRIVSGAVLGGFAVMCISTWITGFSGLRTFAQTMFDMSIGLSSQTQRLKFATFPIAMPNLRGLIDSIGRSHLSASAIQVAVVASSALLILLASRMKPSLPLAILVAILVSYHGLIHDSVLLTVPLSTVLVQSVDENNLPIGIADILLFAFPAFLFAFLGGRYFLMAIPILALLFLQQSTSSKKPRPACS